MWSNSRRWLFPHIILISTVCEVWQEGSRPCYVCALFTGAHSPLEGPLGSKNWRLLCEGLWAQRGGYCWVGGISAENRWVHLSKI